MHPEVTTSLLELMASSGYGIIVSISLSTLEYLPASNQVLVWSGTAERCTESFHTQLNHKHDADRLVFAVSQNTNCPLVGGRTSIRLGSAAVIPA